MSIKEIWYYVLKLYNTILLIKLVTFYHNTEIKLYSRIGISLQKNKGKVLKPIQQQ